jgi:hypothetical protein
MMRRRLGAVLVLLVPLAPLALVASALAAPRSPKPASSASAPSASASASTTPPVAPSASAMAAPALPETVGGCVESFPEGVKRPTLTDVFPTRGVSGFESVLKVVVEHGKGESVLPHGLELQSESDAAKQLKAAGFLIPDQTGPSAARLSTAPPDPAHPDLVKTTLEFPLLALPDKPGRHALVLPPLPVALARANGEIETACTKPHVIVIEEPTASTPDAMPKPNPPARPQREEWTAMKKGLTYGAIGVAAGLVIAYLVYRWLTRERPAVPPPPPRPPWEIALERLDEVRHAGLLEVGRLQEYFDRVNDAVRAYLGARYGFDGLESTTDEILTALRRASVDAIALPFVLGFCEECDLVKFANMTPSLDSCKRALDAAERIVRSTMPRARPGSTYSGDGPIPTPAPPPSAPPEKRDAGADADDEVVR